MAKLFYWLLAAAGLNIILVIGSVIQRTSDDLPVSEPEQPALGSANIQPQAVLQLSPGDSLPGKSLNIPGKETTHKPGPITDDLPEVPSLSQIDEVPALKSRTQTPPLDALQQDAAFQEFREIADEQFPGMLLPSAPQAADSQNLPSLPGRTPELVSSAKVRPSSPEQLLNHGYYELLEQRLETIRLLTSAASNMVQESKQLDELGDVDRAQRFLQRTTELRELAAELLLESL